MAWSRLLVLRAVPRHLDFTGRDVNDLLGGVEVDAAVPALATDTTALDTAERGPQVTDVVRAQPDHARLDRTGDPVATLEAVGPHVTSQSVLDVVPAADRPPPP